MKDKKEVCETALKRRRHVPMEDEEMGEEELGENSSEMPKDGTAPMVKDTAGLEAEMPMEGQDPAADDISMGGEQLPEGASIASLLAKILAFLKMGKGEQV